MLPGAHHDSASRSEQRRAAPFAPSGIGVIPVSKLGTGVPPEEKSAVVPC